jgi:hypothetical protein
VTLTTPLASLSDGDSDASLLPVELVFIKSFVGHPDLLGGKMDALNERFS